MTLARYALGIAAAAALAGCGATQPPIGAVPARQIEKASFQGSFSLAAMNGQPLVYVADGDRIQIVPERPHNARAIARITEGISSAQGLWVDRYGSLYVANGTGTLTVYPRGSPTPSITYYDPYGPKYPVVDHDGNIFVSNSNGTVMEFLRGVITPYRIWKTPGTQADGVDLDAQGNLYVAYRVTNNGYGSIEEFSTHSPSAKGFVLGMSINQPQGLVRASDGTFYAVATGTPESVDVFPPGWHVPNEIVSVHDIPTELVMTANERRVFVAGWFGIYVTLTRNIQIGSNPHAVALFHSRMGLHKYPAGVAGMALSNGQRF